MADQPPVPPKPPGIQLQIACTDGHVLDSPREVTPLPGPGARKIA